MADGEGGKGWWSTLPGTLTALAAIITAVGGLIAVLFNAGLVGQRSSSKGADATVAGAAGGGVAEKRDGARQKADGARPRLDDARVERLRAQGFKGVLATDKAGAAVRLSPNATIVGATLPLTNGQSVDLDRVESIEIAQPWDGRVRLTLIGGRQLDATALNLALNGVNELGGYHRALSELQRIDFVR